SRNSWSPSLSFHCSLTWPDAGPIRVHSRSNTPGQQRRCIVAPPIEGAVIGRTRCFIKGSGETSKDNGRERPARLAGMPFGSRQNILDDVPMNVGQPPFNAVVIEAEAFVVEAEQVQNGGVEIIDGR